MPHRGPSDSDGGRCARPHLLGSVFVRVERIPGLWQIPRGVLAACWKHGSYLEPLELVSVTTESELSLDPVLCQSLQWWGWRGLKPGSGSTEIPLASDACDRPRRAGVWLLHSYHRVRASCPGRQTSLIDRSSSALPLPWQTVLMDCSVEPRSPCSPCQSLQRWSG